MDTNKMHNVGSRPFVIVAEQRVWGVQHVIRDAEGRYHGMVSLSGDSKQRRQQRRALLSQINGEVTP